METKRPPTAEEKKRKKQARKEIEALFKAVKAGCERLKKFEETMRQVEKIKPLMERYKDILDPAAVQEVNRILDQIDRATGDLDQFCELADRLHDLAGKLYEPEIPRWVQDLTPAGWSGLVAAVVVVVIVVGGLVTAFSPWFQATILVSNQGCDAIPAPLGLPNIPGVSLWSAPIRDGETGQANVPPFLQIGVDATQPDRIALSAFNLPLVTLRPAGLKSLLLDGKEIMGQKDNLNTGVQANYTLVIACR